ncbi:MAG TPA: response regulator [Syntrophobacteraceae bacterium]|jgi:CheY-like chemotaxis protein|nr:response regulator [Syntrophobacteraceae bacterium]
MTMKKVLIIDDEKYFCRAVKKVIETNRDFMVLTATRGDEGLRLAQTETPDLILLDIVMPGIAGTQVAEELLEDPATATIPIIFVTAIVKQEEAERNKGFLGGRMFIAKPVVVDELLKKIDSLLSSQ